jgi:hypothetical protein
MSEEYVGIYPYSNTNPTAKFRVAKSVDFQAVINGEAPSYRYTEYDKESDAVNARNRLNAESDENG